MKKENPKINPGKGKGPDVIHPHRPLPSPLQVGDEAKLILANGVEATCTVIAVRFAKNKISYDLNVKTEKGVIPVYNVDSAIVM